MHMKTISNKISAAVAILLFGAGSIFFSSCETNANVDLPEVPPKLVLSCFLTPQDTLIVVRVTKSRPVFQVSQQDVDAPVTDATVRIFGNSGSVQLNYDATLERYTVPASQFPIISGNEYRIEVSAPQVEGVSATTSIPGPAPADFDMTMTYTIDSTDMYNWLYSLDVHTSFTDLPGGGDLYRLTGKLLIYQPFATDTASRSFGSEFYNDANGDGVFVTHEGSPQFSVTAPAYGGDHPVALVTYLVRCSYEYYTYHVALSNYNEGGDPFSEPTLMYSNVNGGYGIFAGACYMQKRINF